MKWILFLALITACGKHQQPSPQDIGDSDGDQIVNKDEANTLAKYIAEIVSIEEVIVSMSILSGRHLLTKQEISLNNRFDIESYSRELILRNRKTLKKENHFSEWSLLRIQKKVDLNLEDSALFDIKLKFHEMKNTPHNLFFVSSDETVKLSSWSKNISLTLSKNKIEAILRGEAHFALGRENHRPHYYLANQEQTIHDKTYRVFMNNGNSTTIYYVSKELHLEDFLKMMKIGLFDYIDQENLLTTRNKSSGSRWWVRDIDENNKVVLKDTLQSLKDSYMKGFSKQNIKVARTNGVIKNKLTISKNTSARFMVKIYGLKAMNIFKLSKKKESWRSCGGGGKEGDGGCRPTQCQVHYRTIERTLSGTIDYQEVLDNLMITSGGKFLYIDELNAELTLGEDKKGPFLEMIFDTDLETLEVSLINKDKTSYHEVGSYKAECRGPDQYALKSKMYNEEANMDLTIEAYVEKI